MKLDDIVAKVRASDDGTGKIFIRGDQVDVDYIVQRTIESLGLEIDPDGTIVFVGHGTRTTLSWNPPGGLDRPKRIYRNGRGVKK